VQQIDRAVFHWINRWSSGLEGSMRFFSEGLQEWWVKLILLICLGAMIAAGKDTRKGAVCALLSWPIADLLTNILKKTIPLPRPCNDPGLDELILRIGKSESAGTASAHSANMLAVAICMLIALRWGGIPWLILAILVALSRIYNGVHYPYQVILGWICGAFAAVLICMLYDFFGKRRAAKREASETKSSN
jgi:undecaprenyl-diphosphatase